MAARGGPLEVPDTRPAPEAPPQACRDVRRCAAPIPATLLRHDHAMSVLRALLSIGPFRRTVALLRRTALPLQGPNAPLSAKEASTMAEIERLECGLALLGTTTAATDLMPDTQRPPDAFHDAAERLEDIVLDTILSERRNGGPTTGNEAPDALLTPDALLPPSLLRDVRLWRMAQVVAATVNAAAAVALELHQRAPKKQALDSDSLNLDDLDLDLDLDLDGLDDDSFEDDTTASSLGGGGTSTSTAATSLALAPVSPDGSGSASRSPAACPVRCGFWTAPNVMLSLLKVPVLMMAIDADSRPITAAERTFTAVPTAAPTYGPMLRLVAAVTPAAGAAQGTAGLRYGDIRDAVEWLTAFLDLFDTLAAAIEASEEAAPRSWVVAAPNSPPTAAPAAPPPPRPTVAHFYVQLRVRALRYVRGLTDFDVLTSLACKRCGHVAACESAPARFLEVAQPTQPDDAAAAGGPGASGPARGFGGLTGGCPPPTIASLVAAQLRAVVVGLDAGFTCRSVVCAGRHRRGLLQTSLACGAWPIPRHVSEYAARLRSEVNKDDKEDIFTAVLPPADVPDSPTGPTKRAVLALVGHVPFRRLNPPQVMVLVVPRARMDTRRRRFVKVTAPVDLQEAALDLRMRIGGRSARPAVNDALVQAVGTCGRPRLAEGIAAVTAGYRLGAMVVHVGRRASDGAYCSGTRAMVPRLADDAASTPHRPRDGEVATVLCAEVGEGSESDDDRHVLRGGRPASAQDDDDGPAAFEFCGSSGVHVGGCPGTDARLQGSARRPSTALLDPTLDEVASSMAPPPAPVGAPTSGHISPVPQQTAADLTSISNKSTFSEAIAESVTLLVYYRTHGKIVTSIESDAETTMDQPS